MFACNFEPHTHSCGLQRLGFMLVLTKGLNIKLRMINSTNSSHRAFVPAFESKRLTDSHRIQGGHRSNCVKPTHMSWRIPEILLITLND